jgi:hypothetical protein
MSLLRPSLFLLLLAFDSTLAAFAPIPQQTLNIADGLGYGSSPKPTPAPDVGRLMRRQNSQSGALLGYYAPDNTCGYIDGNPCM